MHGDGIVVPADFVVVDSGELRRLSSNGASSSAISASAAAPADRAMWFSSLMPPDEITTSTAIAAAATPPFFKAVWAGIVAYHCAKEHETGKLVTAPKEKKNIKVEEALESGGYRGLAGYPLLSKSQAAC